MDENITFKKPENVSREQAATLGVGLLVSVRVCKFGVMLMGLDCVFGIGQWC